MIWVIVIVALLIVFAETVFGKVVFAAAAIGVGLLAVSWITGVSLFVPAAKLCAVVVVAVLVIAFVRMLCD